MKLYNNEHCSDLEISARLNNILQAIGIKELAQLSEYTRDEIANHKYMTKYSFKELSEMMFLTGIRFKI